MDPCPIALLGLGAVGAVSAGVGKYYYDRDVVPILDACSKGFENIKHVYYKFRFWVVGGVLAGIVIRYAFEFWKSHRNSLEEAKRFLRTRTTHPIQDVGGFSLTTREIKFKEDKNKTLRRLRNEFLTRVFN